MRNLLFSLILLLTATACNWSEQVEAVPQTGIEAQQGEEASSRGNIVISAAITEYQLDGQSGDYAIIEFTIAPGQALPEEIMFDFEVTSNYDFEGHFMVSNANWSIENMEPMGAANSFTCTIIYDGPGGFVIEDIICQMPTGPGCGGCQGPSSECVTIGF